MPDAFWQGLDQFNAQAFYDCHDTLEELWMEAEQPLRQFYQGIIQLAVAYYHLGNGNKQGAMILLGQGIQRLEYFSPEYSGVAVEPLIEASRTILEVLQAQEDKEPLGTLPTLPHVIYTR